MRFLARLLLNAVAIVVAAYVVPGLRVQGPAAALMAGIILGFVNAIIRPVLLFLTFPITLLTLGLFIFVVNAVCLALTAAVVPGFEVAGVWAALLGALLVSVVSWVLSALLISRRERD